MGTLKPQADFEARYLAALEVGKKRSEVEMRAVSVQFDKELGRYHVQLRDGRGFTVPLAYIPELNEATPNAMADVDIFGEGEGLYWDGIDEAISLETLINRVFGAAVRRVVARQAASITSEARATAARANGSKGGRPRKVMEPGFVSSEPDELYQNQCGAMNRGVLGGADKSIKSHRERPGT